MQHYSIQLSTGVVHVKENAVMYWATPSKVFNVHVGTYMEGMQTIQTVA